MAALMTRVVDVWVFRCKRSGQWVEGGAHFGISVQDLFEFAFLADDSFLQV